MCKIICIINKNKTNTALINQFLEANAGNLRNELDGYSIYKNEKTYTYMGCNAYDNLGENIKYNGEPLFIIHTRTKTAGSKGIDGLHLSRLNNRYIWCHNGYVTEYSAVKDHNDSYYFFKDLLTRQLNKKNIQKTMKQKGFHGKGFLYDEREDILHVFMNQTVYVTIFPDTVILTSYKPDYMLKKTTKTAVLGFSLEYEEVIAELEPLAEQVMNDEYAIIERGTLTHLLKLPDTWYSGYDWNKGNATYNYKTKKWNYGGGNYQLSQGNIYGD